MRRREAVFQALRVAARPSGDVRVGIARGTRVWVDAASVAGDLGSELGLEGEGAADEPEGAVVPLHVKTVSGDVAVVRAAAALAP